ncbi:ABC transporter ATP-binding protein [Bacillota bacterium Meth-B3]
MKGVPVLSVDSLSVSFYTGNRPNNAVRDVSLRVYGGQTLCVVGESGCGKSVTAGAIMRLLPDLSRIERGSITYHGPGGDVRIDRLERDGEAMRQLRGKDIAMIFQDPMTALNPVYSVGYQIAENLLTHERLTRSQAHERAVALLRSMDIPLPEQRAREYPHQFSGGMRQRAMIAMAMACNPRVLIADEPTTALDVTVQAQIFELIERLKRESGAGVMLITHDMGVVTELADDVAVMYMGSVVEEGPVDRVLGRPAHPYTRALLKSIPVIGRGRAQRLEPIRGSTPDPHDRPPGCQFAPRCDYAAEACGCAMPDARDLPGGHRARCFRLEEVMGDG